MRISSPTKRKMRGTYVMSSKQKKHLEYIQSLRKHRNKFSKHLESKDIDSIPGLELIKES